jgi:hypothetical protein
VLTLRTRSLAFGFRELAKRLYQFCDHKYFQINYAGSNLCPVYLKRPAKRLDNSVLFGWNVALLVKITTHYQPQ